MEIARFASQSPILIIIAVVLHSSSDSDKALHPFLKSIASCIKKYRAGLHALTDLDIQPELQNIYGQIDGDELFIHNELHSAKGLRKIHLEIAKIGEGLQILHCVFFPEPVFDLPIFGVDVVATPTGITAAIVDLSPVGVDLPPELLQELGKLEKPIFGQIRELPEWGHIFSKYVHFIRPIGKEDEDLFVKRVEDYLKIFTAYLFSLEADLSDSASTIDRYNYQCSYCLQQKRNDKTRKVLTKAFNPHWANRYIENLLFDSPKKV